MKNILTSDSLKYYTVYFWKKGKERHKFNTYTNYKNALKISNWLSSAYNTEIKEVIE